MTSHDVMMKVNLTKIREEKTYMLPSDFLVSQAIQDIRETCQGKDIGGPTYAMYLPPQVGHSHGEWLREDLSLEVYELKIRKGTIQFRDTERPLKVKVPDGSVQTFRVDARLPVKDVIKVICNKLDVVFPDEYGLISGLGTKKNVVKRDPKKDSKTPVLISFDSVSNERSNLFSLGAIDRRVRAKKGETPLPWEFKREVFMDPEKTLEHQGISEEATVTLKKRYYFTDHFVDNHPTSLKYNFIQAVNDIMDGHYLVPFDVQVEFSALMLQYCWGDYTEDLFKSIEAAYYLPVAFLEDEKKAKKKIQDLWARMCLERLSDEAIFARFMEKTRTIPDFGTSYFHTLEKVDKKSKDFKIVAFGVSRNYITLVDPKARKIKKQFNLEWVKAHAATPKYFTINFGDHRDEWLTVFTPYSRHIGLALAAYFKLNMLKKKADPNNIVFTTEEMALMNAHYVEEEMIDVEVQRAVLSHIHLGNRTDLIYTDAVPRHETIHRSSSSSLHSPKHPPCVENALAIKLNLPDEKEMERLDGEISLSAVSLSTLTTANITTDYLENLADKDERQWRIDTLNVCRQNVRKHLAPLTHALIGIFEQYSGIHGELDTTQVAQYVQTAADKAGELVSTIRVCAALLEDEKQKVVLDLTSGIVVAVGSMFDSLPKPKQAEFYMAAQLTVLERFANKVKSLLTELVAHRIEPANQEEIGWLGNNILSGCDSLLFILVERILGGLKDQPVAAKIVKDDAAKTFVAVKLLAVASGCLSPLIFDPECKELVLSLTNATSYQIDILENTAKVNMQNSQMKTLLEFNSASVRELINKLLKTLESTSILPDTVTPITMDEDEPRSSFSDSPVPQNQTRTSSITFLLSEIAAITDSSSPHYGDPSVPIKYSKQLNASANLLIQEIRKTKRGIFWDQLIGDITTQTSELSNTLSLYSLSVFKLDEDDADSSGVLNALGEDLNKLAETMAEIEGMWDM